MRNLVITLIGFALILSCSDEWDKHYNDKAENEEISSSSLYEYLEETGGYSKFFELLKSTGLSDELSKDQYLTIWAVDNENFDMSVFGNMSDTLVAGYHLNYLSFGASDLKNGQRIQSMNNIYINISKEASQTFANKSLVVSSKRFRNGVVHEISTLMTPLTNMFVFIQNLGDEYSIIRDSILSYNKRVFDRANSIPIGVNEMGENVYDSVFYTSNALFDKVDFSSEFKQFTMFLPENNVITECLDQLQEQYSMMGKTFGLADSVLAIQWIKEAIFHENIIKDYGSKEDLSTPFNRVWRTSVQQIEAGDPSELSNGIVYKVSKLKIPNNVIISRIKSFLKYYNYLTDEEKAEYFNIVGATSVTVATHDAHTNGVAYYNLEAEENPVTDNELFVEFFPLDGDEVNLSASVMKVPPGEYNLHMGFRYSGHPYVNIYFQSGSNPIPANAVPLASDIDIVNNSTPWNYDRVNDTDPNVSKWNGIGGLVGVVNIDGNEMETFKIKVEFNKLGAIGGKKRLSIFHWALVPTSNNY